MTYFNSSYANKGLYANRRINGLVLGTPTGEFSEEDPQYMEVFVPESGSGTYHFARPCYAFGWMAAPSKEWITKYKDEIFIALLFEGAKPDFPVWIGYVPRDGKLTDVFQFPTSAVFRTEKFLMHFDDEGNELSISQREGDKELQSIKITDAEVTITGKGLTFESENNTLVKGKKHVLEANQLFFGSENATEPSVLGNTLNQNIQELITELSTLISTLQSNATIQATAAAASGTSPLINATTLAGGYASLASSLGAQLPKLTTIVGKLQTHLSVKAKTE